MILIGGMPVSKTGFSINCKKHGSCCRYFKKMMNMSVSDYILEYRMSQALFLLDHSGLSITDIAFQCGFASTSYFIARFKEKMGVTPREYKLR